MAQSQHKNWLSRLWTFLWSPSGRWPLLVLIGVGLVVGIAASATIVVAMHITSTNAFCSSCHEMNIVVAEWKQSPHYVNSVGIIAGCADCHEPKDPLGMAIAKIESMDDGWNHILGTISTPAKFEAHRLELAENVWARLHADNSQECRNCHQMTMMNDPSKPSLRAMHQTALANGKTCIDCHKGVAHKLPTEKAALFGALHGED